MQGTHRCENLMLQSRCVQERHHSFGCGMCHVPTPGPAAAEQTHSRSCLHPTISPGRPATARRESPAPARFGLGELAAWPWRSHDGRAGLPRTLPAPVLPQRREIAPWQRCFGSCWRQQADHFFGFPPSFSCWSRSNAIQCNPGSHSAGLRVD